jgi:plastocyanin
MKPMKMTQKRLRWMLVGMGLAVLSNPLSSQAATANVQVGGALNVFTPTSTNINVGDQVLWTWAGGTHNVTSTNSVWAASPTMSGGTFANTFNTAGTYFYYCTIHGTPTSGMKGAIVVIAPNVPPTVSLTNPPNGTVFAAPANVTLQASPSDSDGTVTNVQFRVDASVVGNDITAPYSVVANSLAAGGHTLTAIASDSGGATATNSVFISVVTPVTVQLSVPQLLPVAQFRFTYTANAGLHYVVQRSTNLLSPIWTDLGTNLAGSSSVNFTDQNATFNRGFYRVGRVPNP